MSEHTHTLDLEEERQRLEQQLEEVSDEAAETDKDSDEYERLARKGRLLDQQMVGLLHLLETYDDPEIVIQEHRQAQFADFGDRVGDLSEQLVGRQSVNNASESFFVAKGLAEAPWFPEGATFEQKAEAVGDLYPQVVKFLYAQINEVSTPPVDFQNGFEARSRAKRQKQTSTDE